MAVSKVGFENPIKPNMQFEQVHITWIDKEAARFGMGRQGFMRQLVEGLINYAAAKSPKVVDSLIKIAGRPLAITRKPVIEEFLPPPPPVKQRPSKVSAKDLPPPRMVSIPRPLPGARTKAAKPTATKKKGAK